MTVPPLANPTRGAVRMRILVVLRVREVDSVLGRETADRSGVPLLEVPVIDCSENGVRLAQNMQVGPCIPAGTQLGKAEVGPASGPTRRRSLSPVNWKASLKGISFSFLVSTQ